MELERLKAALELIASHRDKTLVSMDFVNDHQHAYSVGANRAFEQMADIALEALRGKQWTTN